MISSGQHPCEMGSTLLEHYCCIPTPHGDPGPRAAPCMGLEMCEPLAHAEHPLHTHPPWSGSNSWCTESAPRQGRTFHGVGDDADGTPHPLLKAWPILVAHSEVVVV